MVECAALEMRYTGNRIEGSNPSLSATGLSAAVQTSPKSPKNLYIYATSDSYIVHANLPLAECMWG